MIKFFAQMVAAHISFAVGMYHLSCKQNDKKGKRVFFFRSERSSFLIKIMLLETLAVSRCLFRIVSRETNAKTRRTTIDRLSNCQ